MCGKDEEWGAPRLEIKRSFEIARVARGREGESGDRGKGVSGGQRSMRTLEHTTLGR